MWCLPAVGDVRPLVSDLRQRLKSSRLYPLLKRTRIAYSAFERRLSPVSPLDPRYHLRRFSPWWRDCERGTLVLDVGGGAAPYAEHFTSARTCYVVVDLESSAIRSRRGVVGVIADATALPFRSAEAGIVVMTEMLEHVSNPGAVVREVARVLAPTGILVVTAPQYWHVHGWPSDYYRYTCHGLEHLCHNAGLRVLQMAAMGGPALLLYSVVVLNFARFLWWPGLSLVLGNPLLLACWALDSTVFRHNLRRRNPDTRGWAFVATKAAG